MKYISTRGGVAPVSFQQAVMMGLADDGGLIIPESIPNVADKFDSWSKLDYRKLALEVMSPFVDDIPREDLAAMIDRAYGPDNYGGPVAPLVKVGGVYVLELFHGPTMAFKDVALQLLGNLFEYILARQGGKMNILAATSGDTGSAAIYGVRGRKNINIFVMHPHQRVSPIQERQMTAVLDDNVHNIALKGSFDDCQRIMKELAGDLEFKRKYSLGAVNSVNWARVLAQIVYYFSAAIDAQRICGKKKVMFAVPTGNFGDVLAGWYAMKMGAPIEKLILATNENDILTRFFKTGVYSQGRVYQTMSPSMDIQVASNFERYLYYLVGQDSARLKNMMADFAKTAKLSVDVPPGGVVDTNFIAGASMQGEVLLIIKKYYQQYGYILDPHTACGVAVAENVREDLPKICLATAHPAKFPAAIHKAVGQDVAKSPRIEGLSELPTLCEVMENDPAAIRKFIAARAS